MQFLKSFVRKKTRRFLANDFVTRVFESSLGRLSDRLRKVRENVECERILEAFGQLVTENRVIKGPFEGLVYPSMKAVGSALYPKLLGTYEDELHGIVGQLLNTRFDQIIDVGCAEGYYAVGLAMKYSGKPVTAFEISDEARRLCREMADVNGVGDRLEILEYCTPDELARLCDGRRTLLVSDCEGYEEQLFDARHLSAYRCSDLVIEIHHLNNSPVATEMARILNTTHTVSLVRAETTQEKAARFQSGQRSRTLPDWLARRLVNEERPEGMYWMVAISKQAESISATTPQNPGR